jgi:hypothetical protein
MATSDRPAVLRTMSYASTAFDWSGNDAWSRSRAVAPRLSMEEYYHSQINPTSRRDSVSSKSDPVDDPPSYDVAINGLHLPTTRLKIEPREDQGREQLPAYSCSIMIRAIFSKKMELETAVHTAFDRKWYQVYAELQGTALRFYKVKSAGMFAGGGGPNTSADDPPYLKPGELLKIYSLQHADVGIAADYLKYVAHLGTILCVGGDRVLKVFRRPYVIRVRVEADQFLLSCVEIETFLTWLESLTAAIDLAPPLDERKLPKDTSYPSRHRRRGLTAETIPEESATPPSIAELRNDDSRSERSERSSSRPSTGAESVALQDILLSGPPTNNRQGTSARRPTHPHPSEYINYANPHPVASASIPRASHSLQIASSGSDNNPDITPDGKWRPVHNWTSRHDLVYAKRCMAVLLSNTPRKTNLVIMRGRQWIVDWATGALTRWEPPAYDPPLYTELVGPWQVLGPTGSFLRT